MKLSGLFVVFCFPIHNMIVDLRYIQKWEISPPQLSYFLFGWFKLDCASAPKIEKIQEKKIKFQSFSTTTTPPPNPPTKNENQQKPTKNGPLPRRTNPINIHPLPPHHPHPNRLPIHHHPQNQPTRPTPPPPRPPPPHLPHNPQDLFPPLGQRRTKRRSTRALPRRRRGGG